MPRYIFTLALLLIFEGVYGVTFTFKNNCQYTVWPGILSSSGHPKLDSTGFELPKSTSRSFDAPAGWSGRFWGRTGCNFDTNGQGSCTTGDCGSSQVECNGAGAAPPATLAEFTLGSGGTSQDFYDVSLVDGYNLPMVVIASHGTSGTCAATGCIVDLNRQCPNELRAADGEACRSACEAFGKPEFCCKGEYASPSTCRPSAYSAMFKTACPRSYSYAYDDATSTFTCAGADYEITFCPAMSSEFLKCGCDKYRKMASRLSFLIPFSHINLHLLPLFLYSQKSAKDSPTGGNAGVLLADGYLADLATADAVRVSLGHKTVFTTTIIMMAFLLL